jgi:hypothetical protein
MSSARMCSSGIIRRNIITISDMSLRGVTSQTMDCFAFGSRLAMTDDSLPLRGCYSNPVPIPVRNRDEASAPEGPGNLN